LGNYHPVPLNLSRGPDEDPTPVVPFEWPWDIGETIWPCRDCDVWRAELFLAGADAALWVREWHADRCPIWAEIEGLEA